MTRPRHQDSRTAHSQRLRSRVPGSATDRRKTLGNILPHQRPPDIRTGTMPHVIDHSLTPRAHHRTSWSLPVAVSIALPVAALLAGCGGTVHPTLSELESLPGASAHYPGSVELARFDGDSVNTTYNKQSAILRSNWCAPVNMLAVHSWFARTLADAGWT